MAQPDGHLVAAGCRGAQYLITVVFASGEGHDLHDGDPRFQAWNDVADEYQIGAGWKRDEWLAYGCGFPETKERLARLADDLGVISAMLDGDRRARATFEGTHSRVRGAIIVPKPIQQPRVPIIVGGNGPNVTWRLAARFADELNLDNLTPEETAEALPVIRQRCEEIDRDPGTLPVSIHVWQSDLDEPGQARVDLLGGYRELGLSRAMGLVRASTTNDVALPRLPEDARAACLDLREPVTA